MVKSKALILFEQLDWNLLKEESRSILQLYLVEDLNKQEIANRLKQPINTTKKQLTKAILELGILSEDPQYIRVGKILYGK